MFNSFFLQIKISVYIQGLRLHLLEELSISCDILSSKCSVCARVGMLLEIEIKGLDIVPSVLFDPEKNVLAYCYKVNLWDMISN